MGKQIIVSRYLQRDLESKRMVAEVEYAVKTIFRFIGEDPDREGLKDTPARVARAWQEMTVGYAQSPEQILQRDFNVGDYDEVIACPFIEFTSWCEHHLLPFRGHVHIAYLPNKKNPRVIGLSKMARLVDCFSKRLQIQERLTKEIADAMEIHLKPLGVAVVVQARHSCMSCRGVMKQDAVMVTSAMRGVFRKQGPARAEFFKLVEIAAQTHD